MSRGKNNNNSNNQKNEWQHSRFATLSSSQKPERRGSWAMTLLNESTTREARLTLRRVGPPGKICGQRSGSGIGRWW